MGWENDSGLDLAVGAFTGAIVDGLRSLARKVDGIDVDALEHDVTVEAYNLACAFIDADGLHTDEELWALISTFAKRMDTDLGSATPDSMRNLGMLRGKAAWLDAPSVLLDLVAKADARDGTHLASGYYEQATKIGYTVASLDLHPSATELDAIERFRGMVMRTIDDAATKARRTPAGPGPATTAPVAPPPADDPPARPLPELLAELDGLVGLAPVKAEVKLVANLIQVQNMRKERGLPVLAQSRHLVFTGNPGTGKTTVARLLAQIFRTLGVVARGHLVESDRSQLVAGYVGQTAIQVRQVFDNADQGVLLIDEAYALVRGGERDFGREAIDTIVKLVEDRRDSIVVILAGYPEEMVELVDANPGLRSRFPKTIFFPDYTTDELVAIFESLGKGGRYALDEDAKAKLRAVIDAQPHDKGFGNGRFVRNLFESAVANQATRIVAVDKLTDDQLCALTAADIPDGAPAR